MIDPNTIVKIINELAQSGYSVTTNALPADAVEQLRLFAQSSMESGNFKPAAIGIDAGRVREESIRGDHSLWIDNWKQLPALEEFHLLVQQIMESAKRELFLSARRFEGHFAMYPVGAAYKPHLDQHHDTQHRQLSVVLYLSNSQASDGGELKLHNTLDQKNADILITPTRGTLVVFVSAKIVHEVLPTNKERWSLTGWIRDDA